MLQSWEWFNILIKEISWPALGKISIRDEALFRFSFTSAFVQDITNLCLAKVSYVMYCTRHVCSLRSEHSYLCRVKGLLLFSWRIAVLITTYLLTSELETIIFIVYCVVKHDFFPGLRLIKYDFCIFNYCLATQKEISCFKIAIKL